MSWDLGQAMPETRASSGLPDGVARDRPHSVVTLQLSPAQPYMLAEISFTDTAMPATKRIPARPVKVAVSRKSRESDEDKLASWAEQFDAKVDALTARQDAFLQYLELRQSRQN
jgi:hypothetical protein